jgi:hypothetical protein
MFGAKKINVSTRKIIGETIIRILFLADEIAFSKTS